MLIDDNLCTYQMIEKEREIGSTSTHKIIHEEHNIKNINLRVAAPYCNKTSKCVASENQQRNTNICWISHYF